MASNVNYKNTFHVARRTRNSTNTDLNVVKIFNNTFTCIMCMPQCIQNWWVILSNNWWLVAKSWK